MPVHGCLSAAVCCAAPCRRAQPRHRAVQAPSAAAVQPGAAVRPAGCLLAVVPGQPPAQPTRHTALLPVELPAKGRSQPVPRPCTGQHVQRKQLPCLTAGSEGADWVCLANVQSSDLQSGNS